MKTKYSWLAFGLMLFPYWLFAQQKTSDSYVDAVAPDSKEGWVSFRKDNNLQAETIFTDAPSLFNLQPGDEMRLLKTNTDKAGNKHYKFAQYFQGVRVEGASQTAHERNGKLHLVNGDFVQGINLQVQPTITANRAVEIALEKFPAEVYMWQDTHEEAQYKQKKKDPAASLFPAPELLIVKKNKKEKLQSDNVMLAYRMFVFAKKPFISEVVYVDAISGKILRTQSADITCNATEITTTFNGTQTVYTDYRSDECGYYYEDETAYYPIDDCNPDTEIKSHFSASYDAWNYGDDYYICSDDNEWNTETSEINKMVLTTLWATKKAYHYFNNVHSHESFDGSDGLIDVFSNKSYFIDADDDGEEDDLSCRNANFQPVLDNLHFGSGHDCEPGTIDDYNTLDIVGHEYMHGIIYYAHFDALDYEGESGALNESFADIFGEMVEYYVEGGSLSWLMAEDKMVDGLSKPIRSFSNPNAFDDPDTYYGTNWFSTTSEVDNGGVHTNSSVQNHMFYLLSEGGSGVNDNGIEYLVEGIGYDHARDIAWHAMYNYLDGSDGFITARNAWIQSAIDLFGSCSQQMISVGQAWQAVGVTEYTAFDLASMCGTYYLPVVIDATYGIENSTLFGGLFIGDCTATVNAFVNVTLESAHYIQLNPGFTALSDCTLTAWIDPCEVSDYDPDDVRYANTNTELQMQSILQNNLSLFPVPADDFLQIEFFLNNPSDIAVAIFDINGKEMMPRLINSNFESGPHQQQISVHNLSSGIYVCVVYAGDEMQSEKFIVQHY